MCGCCKSICQPCDDLPLCPHLLLSLSSHPPVLPWPCTGKAVVDNGQKDCEATYNSNVPDYWLGLLPPEISISIQTDTQQQTQFTLDCSIYPAEGQQIDLKSRSISLFNIYRYWLSNTSKSVSSIPFTPGFSCVLLHSFHHIVKGFGVYKDTAHNTNQAHIPQTTWLEMFRKCYLRFLRLRLYPFAGQFHLSLTNGCSLVIRPPA